MLGLVSPAAPRGIVFLALVSFNPVRRYVLLGVVLSPVFKLEELKVAELTFGHFCSLDAV